MAEWRELEPGQWRLDAPSLLINQSVTVAMIGSGERNVFVTIYGNDGSTTEVALTVAEFEAFQKLKVTHG